MDSTPSSTAQTVSPQVNSNEPPKHSPLPWIIVGILAVLLVVMAVAAAFFIGTGMFSKDTDTEEQDSDSDTDEDSDESEDADENTDENDDDAGSDTIVTDNDDSADDETANDNADMTEFWSEYYNSSWYVGFKYPADLIVGEDSPNASHTTITLESGSGIGVLTVWLQSEGSIDDILANMIANQCSDTFTYSDEIYGSRTARKALDVPMAGCLETLGITREQELAAYGIQLPGEVILTIRSDGLNQEQLEALLGTVYGE